MIALATIIVVCVDAAFTWMEQLKRKAETNIMKFPPTSTQIMVNHMFHTSHVGLKKQR